MPRISKTPKTPKISNSSRKSRTYDEQWKFHKDEIYNWIVYDDLSNDEIAERLTSIGLQVVSSQVSTRLNTWGWERRVLRRRAIGSQQNVPTPRPPRPPTPSVSDTSTVTMNSTSIHGSSTLGVVNSTAIPALFGETGHLGEFNMAYSSNTFTQEQTVITTSGPERPIAMDPIYNDNYSSTAQAPENRNGIEGTDEPYW